MGGGGQQRWQQRWQQSGGWWDFQGAVQVQVQGGRRSRLVQRIDVSGTGLDWTGTGDSRAARGPRARARRDGDKIGGETLYGKVEGDAVQLRNVGAPKKAMGWGKAKPRADGRTADDRPIEYPNAGGE